jgi:hypothetical protein
MGRAAPALAARISDWMRQLARSPHPADYFINPIGFPLLRLPWWLEQTLLAEPARAFQADLVYSTVNGYYYIRLLDNVMDGHASVERTRLPAAQFFHTQFQFAYQRYFEAGHPFWEHFARVWFHSAEVTARDADLRDVSLADFRRWAGQKVCAAKIPLAAVCYYYHRPDLLEPWSRFVDAFGAWHQMFNDVFDWNQDLGRGARTYFLCEAERRRRADESTAAWVVREGFGWGVAALYTWLAEAKELAMPLHSPALMAYLDQREAMLREQAKGVSSGLRQLAALATAME